VTGHATAIFGGTAGVAKLEKFPKDKLAQALGLAGHISPGQVQTTMVRNVPATTAKYLLAGWVSRQNYCGVSGQAGHRGDISILDREHGYWRFTGSSKWDADSVVAVLGTEWRFPRATPMNCILVVALCMGHLIACPQLSRK